MTAAATARRARTATGRFRVLVVEDSTDHRVLMRRRLEAAGLAVTVAGDATAALAHLEDVDLVLLDYRLPGLSGLDLLERIRSRERAPSVVMVTGAGSTDVAVRAMRAGAIDYIAKDHGYLDALPEVVQRAWRHHDLAQRAAELQRLALLVASARDRDELFDEIMSGTQHLLRARACALLLDRDGRLEPASLVDTSDDDVRALRYLELGALAATGAQVDDEGRLLVPLPGDAGRPLGVLAVWSGGAVHRPEELDLARAFASFVSLALRNLRQRELERELVAELQQTVDARRDFVASVSHELRTPLTSIIGFVDTLDKAGERLTEEERADMLRRVARNADDLEVLVDALIDLAARDRGHVFAVDLDELRLDEVVRQILGDSALLLAGREVVLEAEPVTAVGDASLVRRILGNLLTNAVKFSTEGSPLLVRVRADADEARVEVIDQGVGLTARQAGRVFEPFFRANAAIVNAVRGSGIGLALVREYVRSMGGRVGVDSEPDHGSTFWFTLPAAS